VGSEVTETVTVKFQDSLLLSIPHIVNFLADTNTDLCVAAANALANLSEQGNILLKCGVASQNSITVDFRESIRISISHIVNFLADDNWAVRRAGIDALGKLSERGEVSIRP
jgi:HEAT repeat protein